jgi:hypothetical protein
MVSLDTPIAHIEGVFNAVVVEGDFVGTTMFQGRGAGQGPTASAVVADKLSLPGNPPPVVREIKNKYTQGATKNRLSKEA